MRQRKFLPQKIVKILKEVITAQAMKNKQLNQHIKGLMQVWFPSVTGR